MNKKKKGFIFTLHFIGLNFHFHVRIKENKVKRA